MAQEPGAGNWLVAEELLERGDPAFVDEIRRIVDADALGAFATRWYADRRTSSRRLLLEYLDRPLNAFRHEALVKRLFKLAEASGDDPVMARFLVQFDRSVRRARGRRRHYESREVAGRDEAAALAESWRDRGFTNVSMWERSRGRYHVWGQWSEEIIKTPVGTAMPRGKMLEFYDVFGTKRTAPDWAFKLRLDPRRHRGEFAIPESLREKLGRFRLFSPLTRGYLRRRAWRYFRKLGKADPARYVAGVSEALGRYEDADVADGLALLDNWGLVHILFHHSPALMARPSGWRLAEGRSLGDLEASPIFGPHWEAAPRALFDLLVGGRCRTVRQWAARMFGRLGASAASVASVEEWLGLLGHEDAEVVVVATETLRDLPGLEALAPSRWLALAESVNPSALEVVAELMGRHVRPEQVTLGEAVRLAAGRPLPLASLGLAWLRAKAPGTEEDCLLLLGLVEAEAEPLRGEIVRWARGALSASPAFRADWVVDYLDSRHADVRAEGWDWFRDEPRVRDDVELWRRLLESPYDDVRLALVAELEARVAGRDPSATDRLALDPEGLRLLWASVLLNVERGGRAKPAVVRQLLRRLEAKPGDVPLLLPLLAVALRSTRGPEWRAGLSAVVRLAERDAGSAPLVFAAFPELKWA